MTDWTTITDSQVDPKAPVTSELMTAMRDNPIAISEGATGAPKVQTEAIQDAAVNRVKLKTATNSGGYSFGSNGGSVTINMDPYSFFPGMTGSSQTQIRGGGADAPAVQVSDSSNASGTLSWRYIEA